MAIKSIIIVFVSLMIATIALAAPSNKIRRARSNTEKLESSNSYSLGYGLYGGDGYGGSTVGYYDDGSYNPAYQATYGPAYGVTYGSYGNYGRGTGGYGNYGGYYQPIYGNYNPGVGSYYGTLATGYYQ